MPYKDPAMKKAAEHARYLRNKETILAHNMAYYLSHRTAISDARKVRYASDPTQLRRFIDRRNTLNGKIGQLVSACKARRDASITKEYILDLWAKQKGLCALTGIEMTFGRGAGDPSALSIDRIDNEVGYHPGNIRLTSMWANLARWVLDDTDLITWCLRLLNHKFGDRLTISS